MLKNQFCINPREATCLAKQKTLQRISIVFQETGDAEAGTAGFNVFLDGLTRNLDFVNPNDLSVAERWIRRVFPKVVAELKAAGAVKSVQQRTIGEVIPQ